jgi:hypothetical protein
MRKLLLLVALGALPLSACTCGIPFSEPFEGSLEIPIAADDDCVFDEEVALDENGDATKEGSFGVVKYKYELVGDECTFLISHWEGSVADMSEVQAEIDASVEEAGFDPAAAQVQLESVTFAEVGLRLLRPDGTEVDFAVVRPEAYGAQLHAEGPAGVVEDVVVLSYTDDPAAGSDPLAPTFETLTDPADQETLRALVQAAIVDETVVSASGEAFVTMGLGHLPDITNDGAGDMQLVLTYRIDVEGAIEVALTELMP